MTRDQLYKLVWSEPATKLAEEFGVSDVAIIKACKRHEVPRPPRGYWAMLQHGYEVERTPLPAASNRLLETVEFKPLLGTSAPADCEPVPVPEKLDSPHPLTSAARQQLRAAKPDNAGLVHTDPKLGPSISVGPASVNRALILFDTLAKAWEARGGKIQMEAQWDASRRYDTNFAIGPDGESVRIFERTRAMENWTPPKHRSWERHAPHNPTGQLVINVSGQYGNDGFRSSWADGKKQRLENMLADVLAALEEQVSRRRQQRLDRECEERQKQRAAEVRQRREKIREAEKLRRDQLHADLEAWHKAKRIREYLSQIKSGQESGALRVKDQAVFDDWIGWATRYADHVDPLIRGGPPNREQITVENARVADLEFTSRTRRIIEQLGVADANELARVTPNQVAALTKRDHLVWDEMMLVLEGCGFRMVSRKT